MRCKQRKVRTKRKRGFKCNTTMNSELAAAMLIFLTVEKKASRVLVPFSSFNVSKNPAFMSYRT